MKSISQPRRVLLLAGAVLAAALALAPAMAAEPAQPWSLEHWVGTWGAAPAGPALAASTPAFADQTLRLIVHTSIGGNRVRIRLSNERGRTALRIGEARIAVRASGADISPGTDRALTFSGNTSVTIPPHVPMLSDPVELNVAPLSDLAVSLYLPGTAGGATVHGSASQASYVSLPGNFSGAASLPTQRTIASMPFLTAVDVDSDSGAIVVMGDSITDGGKSGQTDWLARRLQDLRDPGLGRLGVVNRVVTGNRVLPNPVEGSPAGRSALERFDRDVLATAGLRHIAVMMGIDDIGSSPNDNPVSIDLLIAGYRELIARAHEKGIPIFGATLAPFEGARYYSAQKETVRQALNDWIRNNGEFDGVIDFDHVLRDPAHLARLLPAYDSGDHLHPNELGYQAMADGLPLALFRQNWHGKIAAPG
jgi:lysophospholipase L1-like esterase